MEVHNEDWYMSVFGYINFTLWKIINILKMQIFNAYILLLFSFQSIVMILLCYQLYTGFSGSSMIDQMYLMVFNLLFTSVPPIIVGIYDQDAPAEVLLSQPQLYAQGRESRLYKPHSFWISILDAIYQAIVLFFFAAVVSCQ